MGVDAGKLVAGVLSVIVLSLLVLNSADTTKIIGGLADATTSFARTVIGTKAGRA